MKLTSLRSLTPFIDIADDIRDSHVYMIENVELSGRNIHYPNCLLKSNNHLINPYDEIVMSLNKDSFYDNDEWTDDSTYSLIENTPVYFFHYNVDNYYHYIYDTLPILVGYFLLKKVFPELKLLIATSHPDKKTLPQFVKEFLEILGINHWLLGKSSTLYKKIFVGTSLTHGQKSNERASRVANEIWNKCLGKVIYNTPKRFYISRRSWIHGKTENIGTNYTMRRQCINEDQLVEMLKKYNVEEVFTELLTTDEKLILFKNAEVVVGIIGGGMCNLLFSPPETKSLCITTPHFLDINNRFKFSMNDTAYSDSSSHSEKDKKITLCSRVRIKSGKYAGLIGEVENNDTLIKVKLSSNDIAGFSQDFQLETHDFLENDVEAIDKGLNSPFICDIDKIESDLKSLLNIQ